MKTQSKYFWIGILIYALSFCLLAVGETKSGPGTEPFFGFSCANFAFIYPWVQARDMLLHNVPPLFGPVSYFSLLIGGWINPVFFTAAFLQLSGLYPRALGVLRIVIVSMIPFCWIFFACLHVYPREGHFLWIAAMLLVLFSDKIPTIIGP